MNELVSNPFGESQAVSTVETSAGAADQSRAMSEVQASLVIAKRFPRDQMACMDRILQACTRSTLADEAAYAFPRGGQMVSGPSIRLAETMAQLWGNMDYGIKEMSRATKDGITSSEVRAVAWDLETNTRRYIDFTVKHWRDTKSGGYALKDERDAYELIANQGSRRLRACLLGIIPRDVTEAAMKQCETTQMNKGGAPQDQIKKLVEAFASFGIESDHIVKRLKHRLDSVNQAEILQLKKIYASLRDGMAKPSDFFEVAHDEAGKKESALNEKLKKPAANDAPAPVAETPKSA
jgi:hypothetical protein